MKLALEKVQRDGRHRTLADHAFELIHEAIVTGALEPGQRLPIEELAEVLVMSPMPIREALKRLHSVGLVESTPHRGSRVTSLSVDDLREVYEARLALEALAVRHAAERRTTEELTRARTALTALAEAQRGDPAQAWPEHTEFHFAIYRASHSTWLLRLIKPLWDTSERYRVSVATKGRLPLRHREHSRILTAVIRQHPDRAAALLHNHLVRTANQISGFLDGPTLFELVDIP